MSHGGVFPSSVKRTLLDLDPVNHVLEDLVQRVASVKLAIGVWGPVVKEELVVGRAIGRLPLVKIIGASQDVLLPFVESRPVSEWQDEKLSKLILGGKRWANRRSLRET